MIQNNTVGKKNPFISFVVPMFNEEACVAELYSRVRGAAEALGAEFEIICVDDRSTDSTLALLKEINVRDPRVKIVSFSRNFGHQIAVSAGLRYASGDCTVVLDADLQDPPELVSEMIAKWREGYKVVYGIRRGRHAKFILRKCNYFFYRLLSLISPLPIPADAGDFCLMDARVVKEMSNISENGPYVRGLRAWVGFSQIGIQYDRPNRKKGYAKYNYLRSFKLAVDGVLSFSTFPLKFSIYFGALIAGLSFLYGLYVMVLRLLGAFVNPGWATIVVGFAFLMGVQFILIGIVGEYVGRIHYQTKGRPLYITDEEIGFAKKD